MVSIIDKISMMNDSETDFLKMNSRHKISHLKVLAATL